MDDLIREFLLESYENLDRLDQEFVKLETEPTNLKLLKGIFRTIHTIKSLARTSNELKELTSKFKF